MLSNTTIERLKSFNIPGFVNALIAQNGSAFFHELTFEERLSFLVDTEYTRRRDARIKNRLKDARLPSSATLEEVDFSLQRGLSKSQLLEISQGNWLSNATNIIITGPTGVGKTFLASVIARSICALGFSVRFQRTNHCIENLLACQERGSLQQAIANSCKVPLLIFDEWLLDNMSVQHSRVLLDLFDIRYRRYSCIFISQLPVTSWHSQFADSTIADAVLDRIVHNSIRISLSGESIRKVKSDLPPLQNEGTLRRFAPVTFL